MICVGAILGMRDEMNDSETNGDVLERRGALGLGALGWGSIPRDATRDAMPYQ